MAAVLPSAPADVRTLTGRDAVIFHGNDFEIFIDPTAQDGRVWVAQVESTTTEKAAATQGKKGRRNRP